MNAILAPVPTPEIAARFIANPLKLPIGGKWVAAKSGKTFDVYYPSTGQPIVKAAEGDVALPFGGYKESGWGREMGKEVLELYTETKSVAASL